MAEIFQRRDLQQYCTQCGRDGLAPGARFCSFCGAARSAPYSQPTPSQQLRPAPVAAPATPTFAQATMKVARILWYAFMALVIGFAVLFFGYGIFSKANKPPTAVYGWVQGSPQTFVIQPGSAQSYTWNSGTQAKIDITSTVPVSVGVVTTSAWQDVVNQTAPVSGLLAGATCLQNNVLRVSVTCAVSPKFVFVIVDSRTSTQAAAAGVGAILGIKQPAEQFLQRNDVTVTFSHYGCTANCTQQYADQ